VTAEIERQNRIRIPSPEEQLIQAQQVADWFVPFLYSIKNESGELSFISQSRIEQIVGPHETPALLKYMREIFLTSPSEHQNNVVLYCSGYPADALDILADGDFNVTVELLSQKGEQYRPKPERRRAVVPGGISVEATNVAKSGLQAVRHTYSKPEIELARTSAPVSDEAEYLKWQQDAVCAQTDPEAFFPEKGGSTREAKKLCAACDVRDECLEYALSNDERFGIWGGLSERERRKLATQLKASR